MLLSKSTSRDRLLHSNALHDSFLKIHQEHIIEVASLQKYREGTDTLRYGKSASLILLNRSSLRTTGKAGIRHGAYPPLGCLLRGGMSVAATGSIRTNVTCHASHPLHEEEKGRFS